MLLAVERSTRFEQRELPILVLASSICINSRAHPRFNFSLLFFCSKVKIFFLHKNCFSFWVIRLSSFLKLFRSKILSIALRLCVCCFFLRSKPPTLDRLEIKFLPFFCSFCFDLFNCKTSDFFTLYFNCISFAHPQNSDCNFRLFLQLLIVNLTLL